MGPLKQACKSKKGSNMTWPMASCLQRRRVRSPAVHMKGHSKKKRSLCLWAIPCFGFSTPIPSAGCLRHTSPWQIFFQSSLLPAGLLSLSANCVDWTGVVIYESRVAGSAALPGGEWLKHLQIACGAPVLSKLAKKEKNRPVIIPSDDFVP